MTNLLDNSPDSAAAENSQPLNKHSSAFHDWLAKPHSIVISISILFIIISTIVFFSIYQQYKKSGTNLLSADKDSATLIAAYIQENNNAILKVLTSYAQKQSFIDAAKKNDVIQMRKYLALLKKDQDFNLALITDKRGILWANFPVFPVGSNLSYRDWYKEVSASWKPHVSDIFQLTNNAKPMVTAFSVPVFDEKRNPICILTIYKNLDYLTNAAKQASLYQNITITVTDQVGNIIFDNKSGFQKKIINYSLFPVTKKALTENKKQIEIQNQETSQETSYLSIAEVDAAGFMVIVQRNFQGNLHPQQIKYPWEIITIFALLFILLSLGLMYFRQMIMFNKLFSDIKNLRDEKKDWGKQYHLGNRVNQKNIPLIVWDHDLIIVRFDHVFEEMTGWSKEEVLGKKIDILFPENSKNESLDRISSVTKNEKHEVLEVPILHSDGKTAIARGHYITARKPVEQEISILDGKLEKRVLERTANLEAANRQLESFSYSISQALLTPLQIIKNLCDTLKKNYPEKHDAAENSCLESMHKETKRMEQLIDDMLKLSHLHRTAINRKSFDVSKIVSEIMDECKQKYPYKDIEVTIENDIIVEGDELLLKIALDNLIDNAWKYTISKDHPVIKFGSTINDGKTTLFIRDNGVGFDVAHVNRLFNSFHRIDTSSDFTDIKIGLAIVQLIVDRHGGEIWAESKPGKGATFYFTLS